MVRGNTYSAYMVGQSEADEAKQPIIVRRGRGRAGTKQGGFSSAEGEVLRTSDGMTTRGGDFHFQPPQDANYRFEAACTDDNVETETDLPPCHEATTQTEYIIPKLIPDLSMPVYTGIDKETQIYPGESLFDFDYECEPISRVIVSKILEESQIEVVEEEELASMKKRQEDLKKRAEETANNLISLEDRERNKAKANEKLISERKARKEKLVDVHQHLVSRVYSKRFLGDLTRCSFDILDNMCAFMDEEVKEVHDDFLPWLVSETTQNLNRGAEAKEVIAKGLQEVEKNIREGHREAVAVEMEKRRII